MKRKLLVLLVCVGLLAGAVPTVWSAGGVQTVALKLYENQMAVGTELVEVDAQSRLVAPVAEGGRTLLPVSRVVDAFGGESGWDAATNGVYFKLDGHTVTHVIGQKTLKADGRTVTMDVPSRAMNSRTYVPARYVLEGLGLWVGWEPKNGVVVVSRSNLNGQDLTNLDTYKRVTGQTGDLSAIGARPCVPDLMAYFGLEERYYDIEEKTDDAGAAVGRRVEAELKLASGSDKTMLDGFLSVMEEFGFRLTQVKTTEQDTARFGYYGQGFYFRYDGPGADRVAPLGQWDGAEYHFMVEYGNYYRSGGASRDHTALSCEVSDGLEVIATGVTDGEWNVTPDREDGLPSRPAAGVVYAQQGRTSFAPNLMSYFGLSQGNYERADTDGGVRLRANLDLVYSSDGKLLDDFIKIMQEQGFRFKHVATRVQDTARFGVYDQGFYFRYEGLDKDSVTHLGDMDGKDYDLYIGYGNYYASNGASRDRTIVTMELSKSLTLVNAGAVDQSWKVVAQDASVSSGGSGNSGAGSGGTDSGTGSGGWTPSRPGGVRCGVCGGSGERECLSCSGRGYFERRKSTPNYSGNGPKYYTVKEPCGACRSTGKKPCTYCGGDGKIGA